MAPSPIEELTNAVKDAAYVSVGLGVIAFQRLQVRRTELTKALATTSLGDTKGTLEVLRAFAGEQVKLVEERVSAALDR